MLAFPVAAQLQQEHVQRQDGNPTQDGPAGLGSDRAQTDLDKARDARISTPDKSFGRTGWALDDSRPTVSSTDGRFTMSLRARIQLDAALFSQEDDIASITPQRDVQFKKLTSGAIVRRAYLGIEGRAFGDFWYEYRMDFGGTRLGLTDPIVNLARVSYTVGDVANPIERHFRINAGLIKPIFTLDDATSSASLTFLERADVVNVATGGYGGGTPRLGAELSFQQSGVFHAGDNLVVTGALTGQNPSGKNGALPGNSTHEGTQILGRIAYRLWSNGVSNIQIGGSASRLLKVAENAASGGAHVLTLEDQPEIRVDGNRLVSTGAIPAKGGALWGLEGAGNIRNFAISGEYYNFGIDRDTGCTGCIAAGDPAFSGWYVQASWILTGQTKVYQPNATNNNMGTFANPRIVAPFTLDGPGWGAWEVAGRYSDLDLNWRQGGLGAACTGLLAGCIRGGEQKIWTLGLNWYLSNNLRMLFDYAIIEVNKLNGAGQQTGQMLNVVETRLQFTN